MAAGRAFALLAYKADDVGDLRDGGSASTSAASQPRRDRGMRRRPGLPITIVWTERAV